MGLIKAIAGAAGGVMADQWKEFFTCEALPADVLAVKGQKKTTRRSSNTHGDENIITTGSRIAVADGQCMLIVEQGKIVEVCAEPGEYTYDASTEPTIFAGNLGASIGQVFKNIGKQRSLKIRVSADEGELAFANPLIADTASVHHFGRVGYVGKTRGGKVIRTKYDARRLLGFGREQDEFVEEVLRHMGG